MPLGVEQEDFNYRHVGEIEVLQHYQMLLGVEQKNRLKYLRLI